MTDALARSLKSAIHWSLIHKRRPIMDEDPKDEHDHCDKQALSCPYYVPLAGDWGADWGAILHPQSMKFGQLVFEHEWCGCYHHLNGEDDVMPPDVLQQREGEESD